MRTRHNFFHKNKQLKAMKWKLFSSHASVKWPPASASSINTFPPMDCKKDKQRLLWIVRNIFLWIFVRKYLDNQVKVSLRLSRDLTSLEGSKPDLHLSSEQNQTIYYEINSRNLIRLSSVQTRPYASRVSKPDHTPLEWSKPDHTPLECPNQTIVSGTNDIAWKMSNVPPIGAQPLLRRRGQMIMTRKYQMSPMAWGYQKSTMAKGQMISNGNIKCPQWDGDIW